MNDQNPSSEKSPESSSSSGESGLSYSSCSRSVIFERASNVATVSFFAYTCESTAFVLMLMIATNDTPKMPSATTTSSKVNARD